MGQPAHVFRRGDREVEARAMELARRAAADSERARRSACRLAQRARTVGCVLACGGGPGARRDVVASASVPPWQHLHVGCDMEETTRDP
jgi:hypothetical protein